MCEQLVKLCELGSAMLQSWSCRDFLWWEESRTFAKHIHFGEIRTIMCDQCAELGGLVQYLASLWFVSTHKISLFSLSQYGWEQPYCQIFSYSWYQWCDWIFSTFMNLKKHKRRRQSAASAVWKLPSSPFTIVLFVFLFFCLFVG